MHIAKTSVDHAKLIVSDSRCIKRVGSGHLAGLGSSSKEHASLVLLQGFPVLHSDHITQIICKHTSTGFSVLFHHAKSFPCYQARAVGVRLAAKVDVDMDSIECAPAGEWAPAGLKALQSIITHPVREAAVTLIREFRSRTHQGGLIQSEQSRANTSQRAWTILLHAARKTRSLSRQSPKEDIEKRLQTQVVRALLTSCLRHLHRRFLETRSLENL